MSLLIKFAAGFAILGLLISTSFGIIGGNRIVPLLVTCLVCTLLSGGLGVGVYKILEQRVPEILEIFQMDDDLLVESSDIDLDEQSYNDDQYEESALSGLSAETEQLPAASESKAFGDHLIVENVQIKNEPRLMAAAIKTILAKDES